MITVTPEERAQFRQLRDKLGLDQREFAKKVPTSQSTISNMENGKHPQISREVYAGLIRLAGGADAQTETVDASLKRIMRGSVVLTDEGRKHVEELIALLAKKQG